MPDSGGTTVLDDLPEWILVEEIFVRLPPRDIVRCRAVRRWWRSATSTDKFMLDHHRRQPFLPILSHVVEPQKTSLMLSFDAEAVQQRLCPVIRTLYSGILEATCDGLLIVSHGATVHEFFNLQPDGTLALCGISSDRVTIDIWVVQAYDDEAWSFKHRINLSGMDESPFVDLKVPRMAVLSDGELLIQFAPTHVVRYDIDGRFVEYVKSEEDQDKNLWLTRHRLQESLIPLPLSNEMQEGGAASVEPPFFIGL
ncbi:hypothetical protein CFC21_066723 [Triticum aestivum]|uniref:F-box domain-containing protein n=2 Tax=Triticum aestivum TaxID=4565 RepID=A0A9R1KMU2_WHEAT|nr:hypothetical protein CFC21_066723 [Triticum aestivum]